MAFRQPTIPVLHKRQETSSEQPYLQLTQSQQQQLQLQQQQLEQQQTQQQSIQQQLLQQQKQFTDSQEWILFDPIPSITERAYTNSTIRTLTVGRSQISDFGSLESGVWSYNENEDLDEEDEEDYTVAEDVNHGEDEELDSLDSHLFDFRAESSVCHGVEAEASGTVLPTHDGLGSFKIDGTVMDKDVQEHLYTFEKFNPRRRVKRRRDSREKENSEIEYGQLQESEWLRRIEVWRMEQSRVLVDEIQRESRKREQSIKSEQKPVSLKEELSQETLATLSNAENETSTSVRPDNESFLNRITRKVIRDLIGIDDNLLSIIFGESLPNDTGYPRPSELRRPNPNRRYDQFPWEYKLLDRIARELGFLANKFSDHPSRFNSYILSPKLSLSYAGLPITPEIAELENTKIDIPKRISEDTCITDSQSPFGPQNPPDPEFQPTIPCQIFPISTEPKSPSNINEKDSPNASFNGQSRRRELSREEWERDLDLKMVFRYIYDRVATKFSSSSLNIGISTTVSNSNCSTSTSTGTTSAVAGIHQSNAMNASDMAARAACVRKHHPLISGRPVKRKLRPSNRTWRVSVPAGSVSGGAIGSGALGLVSGGGGGVKSSVSTYSRGSGSCAIGEREKGLCSESSRHYWDWAGSIGSGKATTAMGSWGEV